MRTGCKKNKHGLMCRYDIFIQYENKVVFFTIYWYSEFPCHIRFLNTDAAQGQSLQTKTGRLK